MWDSGTISADELAHASRAVTAPDPQRLGGLAWTRQTGGRLSAAERRRLVAAIALGQWQNAIGRIKLAIGRIPARAASVDLDTFGVPDSAFAREAERACAELPPGLRGHCYRTWLFGCALAAVDARALDSELFYCGSLLHDHGIANPTRHRDFTLGSVDRAQVCASIAGVAETRAETLADAASSPSPASRRPRSDRRAAHTSRRDGLPG
jgi:hypothetical protein